MAANDARATTAFALEGSESVAAQLRVLAAALEGIRTVAAVTPDLAARMVAAAVRMPKDVLTLHVEGALVVVAPAPGLTRMVSAATMLADWLRAELQQEAADAARR